ncbi:hypothetical protein [Rheinheimera sp.]|uniref:hypothetical protein n=1 Tax=Rheinheimera sp. TaxID=1869214 RepID=UPI00404788F5
MTQVIEQVELECTKGSSNKFYTVKLSLDIDGAVSMQAWHGPIGKSGQPGVSGSFSFDVKEAIANRTLDNQVAKLVSETNKLIETKVKKKHYNVVNGVSSINPTVIISRLLQLFPDAATAASQQPKKPVEGAFEVEIIGISAGTIRVAKVLPDYQYDILGEVLNPRGRATRIGDVVSVVSKDSRLELV